MKENNFLDENINNNNNINNDGPLDINNVLEDNKINNVNIPFDQEDDILKSNQIINDDNKDDNYATDSDIDDPKYMPSSNIMENNQINLQNMPNPNIDNQNKSEILLKTKVMALQNDANLANQTMKELENENNLLRTEILKNKEKMQSKEGLNSEFQNLYSVFKQRFEQFEEKNISLQKYIKELEQKIFLKEKEINENNKYKNIRPEERLNKGNANVSLFNDLQKNFTEKKKLLNKE